MIKTVRHKGLRELMETGVSRKVSAELIERVKRRLDAMDRAKTLQDMNLPGFDFHPLKGKPLRYSIHVNGPWCITFEWEQGDILRVDLEQYY